MAETFILNVNDDGKIAFPEEVTESYNLKKGQKLFVIKKQGALEIITSQSELWEKFHKLLSEIRQTVRETGGISEKEVDRKLREIRKSK